MIKPRYDDDPIFFTDPPGNPGIPPDTFRYLGMTFKVTGLGRDAINSNHLSYPAIIYSSEGKPSVMVTLHYDFTDKKWRVWAIVNDKVLNHALPANWIAVNRYDIMYPNNFYIQDTLIRYGGPQVPLAPKNHQVRILFQDREGGQWILFSDDMYGGKWGVELYNPEGIPEEKL